MPPSGKLLAEWFWTDRWTGSSAFMLPQEARGVYREMLTQAWRRGARLPNDHAMIRRATGTTAEEWERAWPLIARYWQEVDGWLVNDTQQEVYQEAQALFESRSAAGKKGNGKRWASQKDVLRVANGIANASPPSPSPSDVLINQERQVHALDGFDQFWSEYPKKKSRSDAEKAWRKLAPSPALCQRIYDAVAAQRGSEDWTKEAGRYVPYAATWIHGRRWEDEVHVPPLKAQAIDWFEECKAIHGGACQLDRWRHYQRKQLEEDPVKP